MIQIAILGRGGQGVVKASQLLAKAAFYDSKQSQASPFFGTERRGSPAFSFVRIDNKEIRTREHIHNPDYLIVLDSTLIGDKNPEIMEINAKKTFINSHKNFPNAMSFDASDIAREFPQALNTVMVAAFCALTNTVSKQALKEACDIFASAKEINEKIIDKVFVTCKK